METVTMPREAFEAMVRERDRFQEAAEAFGQMACTPRPQPSVSRALAEVREVCSHSWRTSPDPDDNERVSCRWCGIGGHQVRWLDGSPDAPVWRRFTFLSDNRKDVVTISGRLDRLARIDAAAKSARANLEAIEAFGMAAGFAFGDHPGRTDAMKAILFDFLMGHITPPQDDASGCAHEWHDARNETVTSGEWCPLCTAIRAGNEAAPYPPLSERAKAAMRAREVKLREDG